MIEGGSYWVYKGPHETSFTSIPPKEMFSLNRVHIIGYQTQPVEVRQTPSGASVTDLNLVVPYSFKSDSGELLKGKGFHTVTVWGPMADVAGQYVKPGSQVFVAGRLQTESWDDQQSGEKRSKTKVVALDLILLDPKDGQMPAPQGAPNVCNALNTAEVVGNVTRDPEMRTTTNGQQVLTLGVATNERWKDKASGEDRDRSEFHNVVVWGELADEVARAVKKGNRVYVSGRVQTRSWETKEGAKRTTTEIIADKVHLLGISSPDATDAVNRSGSQMETTQSTPAAVASSDAVPAVPDISYTSEVKAEDLPF